MQNPHLPHVDVGFSPLELDPDFPLEIVLGGQRDDQPISQLHVHDALEIGCCLEGSGTFYIDAKVLPFREGDMTVITDREFHRCRSSPGSISRWAWFFLQPARLLVPHATASLHWDPDRFCGPDFCNVLKREERPSIAALVQLILSEAEQNDIFHRPNLRSLFVLLLNALHREFPDVSRKSEHAPVAHGMARLSPALELIASRFHEELPVPTLARACGMSVRSFEVQFGKVMGQSPGAYVVRCRVQAAIALLQATGRTIAEVAYECGFGSLSSFNRAFRAQTGTTPRAWRSARNRN